MNRNPLPLLRILCLWILHAMLFSPHTVSAQTLTRVHPEEVGLSSESVRCVGQLIEEAIDAKTIPGAVLAVVRHGKLAVLQAYGNKSLVPDLQPMSTETIFDLASLSKTFGTTLGIFHLLDHGKLLLSDPVSRYLPEWEPRPEVTIRHLLTHTSGLPAYAPVQTVLDSISLYHTAPQALVHYIATVPVLDKPGKSYLYSCLNFVTLQNILERITGKTLDVYLQENIFRPMGLKHTGYLPPSSWLPLVAPTELDEATHRPLLGQVHDPLARRLQLGVSGNAGLFSDAEGLASLCAMLLAEGSWVFKSILSPAAICEMRDIPEFFPGLPRTQGWASYSPYGAGSRRPALYHTGYTGTMAMIDPERDWAVVLLTNRVHPRDNTSTGRLNASVLQVLSAGIRSFVPREGWAVTYYDRLEEFAQEPPISSRDIVMLGNSITCGGRDWNKHIPTSSARLVNRGISGDTADGILYRLSDITYRKPAKIFLLIGINDLAKSRSPEQISSRIDLIIDRIQMESPSTKVYLQTLMPIDESTGRYASLKGKSPQIPRVNAKLREVAQHRGVTLIDLYPHFLSTDGKTLRKSYSTDGLHLNEEGYRVWAKILSPYMP